MAYAPNGGGSYPTDTPAPVTNSTSGSPVAAKTGTHVSGKGRNTVASGAQPTGPSFAIVAVCGVTTPYSKTKSTILTDDWFLADFAKLYKTWNNGETVVTDQVWLTAVNLKSHTEKFGPLLHGPNNDASTRPPVFEASDQPFYNVCRKLKLLSEFRLKLNIFFAKYDRILVIINAHGEKDKGGFVWIGGQKFFKEDFEVLIPSRKSFRDVTLFMSSCFAGKWQSPKWTLYTASDKNEMSMSYRRSFSDRHRGGVWAGTLSEQVQEGGADAMAKQVFEDADVRAHEVDHMNPPYTISITRWDHGRNVRTVMGYESMPRMTFRVPKEESSGESLPDGGHPFAADHGDDRYYKPYHDGRDRDRDCDRELDVSDGDVEDVPSKLERRKTSEHALNNRPDLKGLVDKNILHGTGSAAVQIHQKELEHKIAQGRFSKGLAHCSNREELEEGNDMLPERCTHDHFDKAREREREAVHVRRGDGGSVGMVTAGAMPEDRMPADGPRHRGEIARRTEPGERAWKRQKISTNKFLGRSNGEMTTDTGPSRLRALIKYYEISQKPPPNCVSEIPVQLLLLEVRKGRYESAVIQELEELLYFRLKYDMKAVELLSLLGRSTTLSEIMLWRPEACWLQSNYSSALEVWEERRGYRAQYNKPLLFVLKELHIISPRTEDIIDAVAAVSSNGKNRSEVTTSDILTAVRNVVEQMYV